MRSLKPLALSLFLIGALPMFGAIYLKLDGVDGDVSAAGHEKWIQIDSVQMADGTPMAMLDAGRVRVSSGSLAKLERLCQSKRPLGNVLVDVDGKRHLLRNARFAECPTSRGGVATAVLEFGGGSTSTSQHQGRGVFVVSTSPSTPRGNATIAGLGRTQLAMNIRRASVSGKIATIAVDPTDPACKPIMEATAKGTVFPVLVIESAGQKWSFTKAIFTSANFSPGQHAVFSMQFETMDGSATAFEALGH